MRADVHQPFFPAVAVLAAGRSQRMGSPKLLLPWSDSTVLGHLVRQWRELGAQQIGVVYSGATLLAELDRLGLPKSDRIENPDPDRGMFSSIRCAAEWNGWQTALTHWILTLGDQPQVRRETLAALLEFGRANPDRICQPMRHGRRKHPVLLPKRVFHSLKETVAADLKAFLAERAGEVAGWESEDAGLDLDLDTPADYERARALAG